MAILDSVPGLKVTVVMDGKDLDEYPDEQDEILPNTHSAYIEAKSGVEFCIRLEISSQVFQYSNNHHDASLYLDGQYVTGASLSPDWIAHRGEGYIKEVRKNCGGRDVIAKPKFTELKITEESADPSLVGKVKALGIIRVDFRRYRSESLPNTPAATSAVTPSKVTKKGRTVTTKVSKKEMERIQNELASKTRPLKDDEVPEKNLKGRGISHQAKLTYSHIAPPRQPKSGPRTKTIFIDQQPYASFSFKYRSREALQHLLLVPSSPAPLPLEERAIEDLTPAEMRELLIRQRAKEVKHETTTTIKKERREGDERGYKEDDGDLVVIGSQSTKDRSTGLGNRNDIIILSDDEDV